MSLTFNFSADWLKDIFISLRQRRYTTYILLIIHACTFYLYYWANLSAILYFIIFSLLVDIHMSALANIYPVVCKLRKNHEKHLDPKEPLMMFHDMSNIC